MQKISIYIQLLCIICLFASEMFVCAQPASILVNSETLYQAGRNAGGADTDENIDSVTIDGITRHYYYPDAAVNAGFSAPFTNIISSFNWTVAGVTNQVDAVTGFSYENYKQITWKSLGTATIKISETAHVSLGGCTGNEVVDTVEVIAKPSVTAVDVPNVTCQTMPFTINCPNANLTISSSVKGNKGYRVVYTLTGPSGYSVSTSDTVVSNTGVLDLSGRKLTTPGAYTLTITKITDRIAYKCGYVGGSAINVVGMNKTFYVTPLPKTGTNKHVANDAAW